MNMHNPSNLFFTFFGSRQFFSSGNHFNIFSKTRTWKIGAVVIFFEPGIYNILKVSEIVQFSRKYGNAHFTS
jgi:hypothetical protein